MTGCYARRTIMNELMNLLKNGKTQFHVVDTCKQILSAQGFELLPPDEPWQLVSGKKYMTAPYSSMLVAWVMGEHADSVRFAAAHTDFPMLKLKPNPEITRKGYVQINVEPYGGLITQTWFDRPLGLAGKVILRSGDIFKPKVRLFDSGRPVCIIPNLAPHLKRDSKVQDVDVQKELIPVLSTLDAVRDDENAERVTEGFLLQYLADTMQVKKEDILDYDLYLYIDAKPSVIGLQDEFIAAARIDNISSVSAIMEALCAEHIDNCIAIGAFFDNEEIGSRSKQGADSLVLRELTERILPDKKLMNRAFNMSVDVAHATHPNYPEKSDITNDVILGGGVVLKTSAAQKYVTDSEAGAVVAALSKENNIKIQRQVNRSGMAGGQTLGPIMAAYLPVKSVDIGIPMLAMHSACELVHSADYAELIKLLTAYFQY